MAVGCPSPGWPLLGAVVVVGSWECHGVWLAGHGGQGGGDLLQAGLDVGGCSWAGVVGVSREGAGNPVPEVAFDPGEGGVSEPVGGDALGGDPGESVPEAFPEVVVAAAGDDRRLHPAPAGAPSRGRPTASLGTTPGRTRPVVTGPSPAGISPSSPDNRITCQRAKTLPTRPRTSSRITKPSHSATSQPWENHQNRHQGLKLKLRLELLHDVDAAVVLPQ